MDEKEKNELKTALEGLWGSLSDEQKKKAKACQAMDELIALAGKEGVELPNELLETVAGGYIVDVSQPGNRGGPYFNYRYMAVDDTTGEKIGSFDGMGKKAIRKAQEAARNAGQSEEEVSRDFVNELRRQAGIAPISGCNP